MSLISELKRRNVVRVGIAYLVVSWLVLQVADVVFGNIGAPEWLFPALLTVIGLGLPIALALAWAFELTPEGLKRDHEVERDSAAPRANAGRLNIVIIAALSLALAYFVLDKFILDGGSSSDAVAGDANRAIGKSIVVLPFANRSVSTDDEFFVDGMHDDILTQLSKLSTLDKVISRTTAMSYLGTTKPIDQIAEELGVATVLEGGVQRAGDTIRINMQLIDATTDQHLWAEIFERQMTVENLFAIQTEITREVVNALNGVLSEQDREQLDAMPTDSLEAYKEYTLGRQQLSRRTGEAVELALEHFRRATELDAGYALAWVGVADSLSLLPGYSGISLESTFDERRAAIDKALAIDPLSGEAYTSLASLTNDREGPEQAVPLFERAIELNANYPTARHWYALALNELRRFAEGLVQIKKARDVDPVSPILSVVEVGGLMNAGRFDEAERVVRESIKRNPEFPSLQTIYADLLVDSGELADGLRWSESAAALSPESPYMMLSRCNNLVEIGLRDAAAECVGQLQSNFPALPMADVFWVRLAVAIEQSELPALRQELQTLPNDPASVEFRTMAAVFADDAPGAAEILRGADGDLLNAEPVEIVQLSPALALAVAGYAKQQGDEARSAALFTALQQVIESLTPSEQRDQAVLPVVVALLQGDQQRAAAVWQSLIDRRTVSAWWTLKAPGIAPRSPSPEWQAAMASLDTYVSAQREKYLAERDQPLVL